MSKVKKQNRKRFKAFRKNNGWIGIIFLALAYLGMVIIVFAFTDIMSQYVMNAKVVAEVERVAEIVEIYNNSEMPAEEALELLGPNGESYVITDSRGGVIYEHGENTLSHKLLAVKEAYGIKYRLYADSKEDYIFLNDDHELEIDPMKVADNLTSGELLVNDMTFREFSLTDESEYLPEDIESTLDIDTAKMINFPIWVAIGINNSSQRFVAKCYISYNLRDMFLAGGFAMVVLMGGGILFIVLVINFVISIHRQHNTMKLFFTDIITREKNWMWFLYKGEPLVKIKYKNTYAVVNLVFVKYRTFCVCHSVDEGELMLRRVYNLIEASIGKKELISHCTPSHFALLLKADDKQELDNRLKVLINRLKSIDDEHDFNFQIGVDFIEVKKNDKGKITRRRFVDLTAEYNNACAARSSLEDTEASGIAYFDDELVQEQKWKDLVQENQRQALEKEEFVVYYQPKYNPRTKKLTGAEALIRWDSPVLGFISPGRFIPIFEANGFIKEIDHYMVSHVARDQKRWKDMGLDIVPVSVNISRAHFIEGDLAEQIRDMVDAAGADRKFIEIELTESAFFDDKKALIKTITTLKEYGFMVSMDDFGAGYSSLNSLKDMPLDVLKIDADFFRGDQSDDRGKKVITETINLARSLEMLTVAEGVEDAEQVELLANLKCDMIQGYFFDKPMPGDQYEIRMELGESIDKEELKKYEEERMKKARQATGAAKAQGTSQAAQTSQTAQTTQASQTEEE
ncbi:MAG: EAL domain-containing protein [Lachnospiraceae bacterium]|nr:EAL domain-containing protein [Lachnospiraceae bacterium]